MIKNNKLGVILNPYQVELNAILTVRSAYETFKGNSYTISDESGKLIRKGSIASDINEFKLCIVGFKEGEYSITIGLEIEKFFVI